MTHGPKFVKAIEALTTAAGRFASWLLLPLMAVIMLDVVGRRFFRVGSVGLQEIEWHLHTVIFLFAAAYGYLRNTHVRIDMLRDRCSERVRGWIEALGCLLFLIPYSAMLCYLSFWFWKYAWDIGEISDSPGGLPARWAIKAVMPVAFALLFLQGWATLGRKIIELRALARRTRPS